MEIQEAYTTAPNLQALIRQAQLERAIAEAEIQARVKDFEQRLALLHQERTDYLLESNHRLGVLDGKIEAYMALME
jgi:hypothetical protein